MEPARSWGSHRMEERLNRIAGLNVLHLRAGYFMENTLAQVGIIHKTGTVIGALLPDLSFPMIATRDIGDAAAEALLKLDFHRHQTRELLGPNDITMTEVAAIIGKAIGKPDLKYVQAPDEQIRAAMLQMGMSEDLAGQIAGDDARHELRPHEGPGAAQRAQLHAHQLMSPSCIRNSCRNTKAKSAA